MIQASVNLLLDNITFSVTPKGKSEMKDSSKNAKVSEGTDSMFEW
jgi:hypothetical protein